MDASTVHCQLTLLIMYCVPSTMKKSRLRTKAMLFHLSVWPISKLGINHISILVSGHLEYGRTCRFSLYSFLQFENQVGHLSACCVVVGNWTLCGLADRLQYLCRCRVSMLFASRFRQPVIQGIDDSVAYILEQTRIILRIVFGRILNSLTAYDKINRIYKITVRTKSHPW